MITGWFEQIKSWAQRQRAHVRWDVQYRAGKRGARSRKRKNPLRGVVGPSVGELSRKHVA